MLPDWDWGNSMENKTYLESLSGRPGSGYRVLIVDDDPQVRKILERMLVGLGSQVQTASDGQQALEIAPEFQPDLVILDIMMPGMSGIEVCRNLRKTLPQQKFQILLVISIRLTKDVLREPYLQSER